MMDKIGYTVNLYASTESDFPNTIPCVLAPPTAKVTEPEWSPKFFESMNTRAIFEIEKRIAPGDIIGLITGTPCVAIKEAFPNNMCVEYGVGYEGVICDYRVFESYAWMHTIYGFQAGLEKRSPMSATGRFYDCVIPNYFEIDQFPEGDGSGDYLFYIGRLIDLKGVSIAVDMAKRNDIELVIAGQGTPPPGCTYKGVVGPEERSELMGKARAVVVPSLYLEPFGGVNVEAQICGTPVITTDWGAFPETVSQGVTGYRCRTMREFDAATRDVLTLDRKFIRERASFLYSTETCAAQYDTYFQRLVDLSWEGFHSV
jgi:glycosyltransferase involved in cell wall biosynthesis